MPRDDRKLTRAARARAKATGESYTAARRVLLDAGTYMAQTGEDAQTALAVVTDPANQDLCEHCGWTVAMVCPECNGCGCDGEGNPKPYRCSGWRHEEYMSEDEREERDACEECGGDTSSPYGCACDDDVPGPYYGEELDSAEADGR